MKSKVAREVAQAEIEKWLDYKKIKEAKREAEETTTETIVDAICDGTLVLNKDYTFTHKLAFPLKSDGEDTLKELTYKPRLEVREINTKMKGIKPSDADGRIMGYIAALTDQPRGVLTRMDTEDNRIAQAFATFFL